MSKPASGKSSSQCSHGRGGKASAAGASSRRGAAAADEFPSDSDSDGEDGLLPDEVSPVHYALTLQPDYDTWTFTARVSVLLRVDGETDLIQFNAAELAISSARLTTISGEHLEPSLRHDEDEEVTTLRFDAPLALGEATLELEYTGAINTANHGLFRSQYMHQDVEHTILVTQAEACDARRFIPCWDEPSRKATYSVTLRIPSRYTALSNMPVLSITPCSGPGGDGLSDVSFQPTPIMSSYLLCFAVGEFESTQTSTSSGTLVRVLTPLGKIDQAAFSVDLAKRCVEFYDDYFSLPYPLPKMDLLAVPDLACVAMENWGLITFAETSLLVHPTESSQDGQSHVALLVAHEIAHQWFGNITTMDWWSGLWLNEGFATWMEHFAVDHIFPSWRIWEQYLGDHYADALSVDALVASHPVEVEVDDPSDIDEVFDRLSYSKGSMLVRMLHSFLGPEEFRKGISAYLKKYSFANACTKDLWSTLSESSGRDVRAMMSQWAQQTGYPLITVKSIKTGGDGKVVLDLAQKIFLLQPTTDKEKEATKWSVPVTAVAPGGKPTAPQLLTEVAAKMEFALGQAGAALKLNASQVHFYRVQYPLAHYAVLRGSLASFGASDRLGLQNDLFALCRIGQVPFATLVEFVEAYRAEDEPTVWTDLCTNLRDLGDTLRHAPNTYTKYSAWVCTLCEPVLERLGWAAKEGDDPLANSLRGELVAMLVDHGHGATVREACRRFHTFIAGESAAAGSALAVSSALSPDLREGVYAAVASQGGLLGFEMLRSRYLNLSAAGGAREECVRCLNALAATGDRALLTEAMEFALSPAVRSEDAQDVLLGVAANIACGTAGALAYWSFAKREWPQLVATFEGAFGLSGIVDALSYLASTDSAKDVAAFFKKHRAPTAERAVRQVQERITSNAKWLARDEKSASQTLATRLAQYQQAKQLA